MGSRPGGGTAVIERDEVIEDKGGIVRRVVTLHDKSHDKRGVQVGPILWELQSLNPKEIIETTMEPVLWAWAAYRLKRVRLITNLSSAGTSGKWQQGSRIPPE